MKGTFRSILTASAFVAGTLTAGAALADEYQYEVVDGGIPKAHTDQAGDPAAGRKAMVDRKGGNCIACHTATALADQPFPGTVGPVLDGVAERYSEAQLRLIVTNAKQVFDGTVMPAFMKKEGYTREAEKFQGKSILEPQQVEDVVAFLKTLK